MSEGLIWFICLAPIGMVVIYAIDGWLNYRENPLYWRAMLSMLTPGQVRWSMLSKGKGEVGHTIFVVKEIRKPKRKLLWFKTRIIFDRYYYNGERYICNGTDIDYSLGDFYRNTDPEPVNKEDLL